MTHAYLGLAAFDATTTVVGYALLVCLGVVRTRRRVLPCLGLAFLTGWSLTGVVLALGVSVGVDPSLTAVLVIVVAGGAALYALRSRFPPIAYVTRPREGPAATAGAVAGAALLVATAIAGLAESVRSVSDMSYDVWTFWLPKAEAIYYFHGLDTGLSGYTTYANPDYPPLIPAIDAASFHFMGGADPWLLSLQQNLLFVAFLGSIAALSSRVPRWILFPLLAALALAPQLWSYRFTLMPDQTLAYLVGVAAVCGLLWLEDRRAAWLVLTTVFLAAAALTKDEGVLLGGLLAITLLGADLARRGNKALASTALLIGPLATIPWRAWLALHHQPVTAANYSWLDLLHPIYAAHRLHNLRYASRQMIDLLGDPGRWSPVLPLALATLIVLAPLLRELSLLVCVWVGLAFAGLASVYWIGRPDVHWYVSTSAYRVLDSLPVVAGATLPLLLGIAIRRQHRADSGHAVSKHADSVDRDLNALAARD